MVGSRFNYLDVWNIETKSYVKKLELSEETSSPKDCLVVPGFCYDNKIVVVLTQDGHLSAYNMENSQLIGMFSSPGQSMISEFKVIQMCWATNSSRYFCALTQDGCIQVYDLDCSFLKSMKVYCRIISIV